MTGLGLPDFQAHRAPFDLHRNAQLAASGIGCGCHQQLIEIDVAVLRHLVAVAIDGLGEIPLAVEQADGNERDPQVAGGLAVVAGEDAEAAGINREALVKTKLRAKIGDQIAIDIETVFHILIDDFFVVGPVGGHHPVVLLHEQMIVSCFIENGLRDAA